MMKNNKLFIVLALSGLALGACNSNNKNSSSADSSKVQHSSKDTLVQDTSAVKQADSLHSYRNDRSTDSVAVGKNIPAKR